MEKVEATILIFLITSVISFGQTQKATTSAGEKAESILRQELKTYFSSYSKNSRTDVTMLGGGWAREKFQPLADYKCEFDGNAATCTFTMIRYITGFHKTKEDAEKDTIYVQHSLETHRHYYTYNNGKWTVDKREHKGDYEDATWIDCNEVIKTGENAGNTNINGCWEANIAAAPISKALPSVAIKHEEVIEAKHEEMANFFEEDCTKWISTWTDEVTGKTSTGGKSLLTVSNDPGQTALVIRMLKEGLDNLILWIHAIGAGACIDEGSKINILFIDGSRLELNSEGDFNCRGESTVYFGTIFGKTGELQELKTKKIKTMRVWTSDSYVQQTFSDNNQEEFYNVINCLSK